MRVARFEHGDEEGWGFIDDATMVRVPSTGPTLLEALTLDEHELVEVHSRCRDKLALDEIRLLAPVPQPPQFLGVGLNYHDHAAESGMEPPPAPVTFGFHRSAVIGPGDEIELPHVSDETDWEIELAIVIGKPGKRVPLERALDHVAGYTIVNDVSARDVQLADGQWTRAKSFDTFKPMGPCITTVHDLGPAADLDVELRVNDVVKQTSNTSNLIFDVPYLVHFLSQDTTLETGCVISTGTPGGVGFARRPPEYLRDGDVVHLEISGIGVLTNSVVGPR